MADNKNYLGELSLNAVNGAKKYTWFDYVNKLDELILEFKLVMDTKRSDCERIAYNLGDRCVLTATQFLYAYEYHAFA